MRKLVTVSRKDLDKALSATLMDPFAHVEKIVFYGDRFSYETALPDTLQVWAEVSEEREEAQLRVVNGLCVDCYGVPGPDKSGAWIECDCHCHKAACPHPQVEGFDCLHCWVGKKYE